jgi:hypothetical protein
MIVGAINLEGLFFEEKKTFDAPSVFSFLRRGPSSLVSFQSVGITSVTWCPSKVWGSRQKNRLNHLSPSAKLFEQQDPHHPTKNDFVFDGAVSPTCYTTQGRQRLHNFKKFEKF